MVQKGSFSAFLIGGQSLLIRCAEVLLERKHLVRGLISSDPEVVQWARERELVCLNPEDNLLGHLVAKPFDYLFSIVNLTVLPDALLALPEKGAINFHDGPLPAYAGLHAPAWALINRETSYGVTWHRMTHRVDGGDILEQRRFRVAPDETALSLNAKCFEVALSGFETLVDNLSKGRVQPRVQDLERRFVYPGRKRPKAACLLNWAYPGEVLGALARALTYGPYPNPLGLPKLWLGAEAVVVEELHLLPTASAAAPGTVLRLSEEGFTVATVTCDLELSGFATLSGHPLSARQLAARSGLHEGQVLPSLEAKRAGTLTARNEAWAKHESFWEARLADLEPPSLPYLTHPVAGHERYAELTFVPKELPSAAEASAGDVLLAAHALLFARLATKERLDFPFQSAALRCDLAGVEAFFASHIPLPVTLGKGDFGTFLADIVAQARRTEAHHSYARDLPLRHPQLRDLAPRWHQEAWPVALERRERLTGADKDVRASNHAALTVVIPDDARSCRWRYDPDVLSAAAVARMQAQLAALLASLAAAPQLPVTALSILSDQDVQELEVLNATACVYPRESCVHELVEAQVARTPDAVALAFREHTFSYRELNARANRLARALKRGGVGAGARVAVLLERGLEMVVALLGVLKAGAAYVPLDPTYPEERLRFMAEDAQVAALITQPQYQKRLSIHVPTTLLGAEAAVLARESPRNLALKLPATGLAYVIYTSGSTGMPKGVMVEHRNVVNFFAGMDERLGTEPGVWLALTSISFDISVLELFWTLSRGFKVVLYADENRSPVVLHHANKPLDFSLFYFASGGDDQQEDPYRLLLEGAAFADAHDFAAVWTPERHFHAFGGLYPNPAVTAAALATMTSRVQLRAGSCVLPLHHPVRVAEEWALVDNLSKGRVGVSFASGWQPDDFILAPHTYSDRHAQLERGIETVRALWRGETLPFPGPRGEVGVRILPRPLQAELPTWITAAGNPDTFRKAGEMGANVLTHLLGQTIAELAEKLVLYREAWARSKHPGRGYVSLMLHTFVAEDEAAARAQVHGPLKAYLKSATGLLRQYASTFPTFRHTDQSGLRDLDAQFGAMSEGDLDALLEHAFGRYYTTSGLFGTPEGCLGRLDTLRGIGVDDVACLIDFGIPAETVLANLPHLERLRRLANTPEPETYTIPNLIARHGVTHLQCTPSMAKMLTLEPSTRDALRPLKKLLVGGEALPSELAATLASLVVGEAINMYGPTETTIWSATYPLRAKDGHVLLGTPIANTQVYILDANLQLLPPGVPGELVIAGQGVVRGYLNRPETTAERFLPNPFGAGRIYRTGDLARYRAAGGLEFLGRLDHQVKIRGYRIELGEIETALGRHPGVRQTVVSAREDAPGDVRLVAYIVPEVPEAPSGGELRGFLQSHLPEHMLPSAFVTLAALPLTPNQKVDRRALPVPEQGLSDRIFVPPRTPQETLLAEVWERVLNTERVGAYDNFFELGGNSLLALHAMSQTVKAGLQLTLKQLFQYPTVAELALQTAAPAHYAEQGTVTGSFPLPPSAYRFFYERNSPDPHHWNHALLLEAKRPLEPSRLRTAVEHLFRHHDALRLRFQRHSSGWRPSLAEAAAPLTFTTANLSALPEAERVRALERAIAELQGSLDLAAGPLARVAHFDLGPDGHRLFVTMHHLVLDPISWRIFWEDLQTAYGQVERDEAVRLSPKTTSYKAWAEALAARAQLEARSTAVDAWLALPWSSVRPLPLDSSRDRFRDNTNASFGVVTAALHAEETSLLLEHTRSGAYRTEEVLIAALVKTFARWTGSPSLLFDMVGLSRAENLAAVDLSRTLGYFVAYVPLLVTLAYVLTPEQALRSVAEQLRTITPMGSKHDLLRYLGNDQSLARRLGALPRAEVLFNYRGSQEHDLSFLDPALFQAACEAKGPSHSPRGLRHHPLNIAGDVLDAQLHFTFTFSKNLHRPATIEQLANRFVDEVQLLVRALVRPTATSTESLSVP